MAKIILITHQKGGVGKSTLAFNLAVNIRESAKVCLVDLDEQGSLLNIKKASEVPIYEASKLKELLKSDYDFIFIDTPPYLTNQLKELCDLANVIIIPTKAGILDLLAIKSTIEIIEESNNGNKALIVFNMVKTYTTLTDDIKSHLGDYDIKISKNMISDLVAFSRSILVNGVEENNKAQKQIDNLTKEVLTLSIN